MSTTDPTILTRDELVRGLTVLITEHRQRTNVEKIRIGLRWDPQPASAEAEACAELLIDRVQTLRAADAR